MSDKSGGNAIIGCSLALMGAVAVVAVLTSLLAPEPAPPRPHAPPAAPESPWTLTRTRSPMTDDLDVHLHTAAALPLAEGPVPRLWLRCQERHPAILIEFGTPGEPGRLRYDQEPARRTRPQESSDFRGWFLPVAELEHLARANVVTVEFTPVFGATQHVMFPLWGLDEHLPILRGECRW